MYRPFPCFFAPQTTAQSLLLPFLPLIRLSVGGLSWWNRDEHPSLPRDLFPSVFAIFCLFFFLLPGVTFNHVLRFWWWSAHVSVCHPVHVDVSPGVFGFLQCFSEAPLWQAVLIYDSPLSHHNCMSPLLTFNTDKILHDLFPRPSPRYWPPSSPFPQLSSFSSQYSHLTTVPPVIRLESRAL